ncbi:MAG: hypothetical protein AAF550_14665, partial [Myxococcota bacterium]
MKKQRLVLDVVTADGYSRVLPLDDPRMRNLELPGIRLAGGERIAVSGYNVKDETLLFHETARAQGAP